MYDPRGRRIGGIGACPADGAIANEGDIRLSISVHVSKNGDFGRDRRQDVVLIPAASLALWVDIKRHRSATRDQDIRPAVAGVVVSEIDHRRCQLCAYVGRLAEVDFTRYA